MILRDLLRKSDMGRGNLEEPFEFVRSEDASKWRFKYFPPQWRPQTLFDESTKIGLHFDGSAILLKRSNVTHKHGVHYTTFDFLVHKTVKSKKQAIHPLEACRRATARLHSYISDDSHFPTKEGMNMLRNNTARKLQTLRDRRSALQNTFQWLDEEQARIDQLKDATVFFSGMREDINAIANETAGGGGSATINLANTMSTLPFPNENDYKFETDFWTTVSTTIEQAKRFAATAAEKKALADFDASVKSRLREKARKYYKIILKEREMSRDAQKALIEQERLRNTLLKIQKKK